MHLQSLLVNKNIIELGCGVGALSLLGTKLIKVNQLVLTDGQDRALSIAKINAKNWRSHDYSDHDSCDDESIIRLRRLQWGNEYLINAVTEKCFFDVVIACELMYYNSSVSSMLDTVMKLTAKQGKQQ